MSRVPFELPTFTAVEHLDRDQAIVGLELAQATMDIWGDHVIGH